MTIRANSQRGLSKSLKEFTEKWKWDNLRWSKKEEHRGLFLREDQYNKIYIWPVRDTAEQSGWHTICEQRPKPKNAKHPFGLIEGKNLEEIKAKAHELVDAWFDKIPIKDLYKPKPKPKSIEQTSEENEIMRIWYTIKRLLK
jgi:hypothetical protein